ncbi:hypothetical protein Pan216_36700 [Planctomycetes bacterium Pan216]|uniref:Uncharacterized protein n=1 Tax=Kolteria novifilia TaxID=2527975 RepID=A0A518B748_9BACT|nr:hypothetical protein Pan216_36700 [Planctomycetes bacterium Pan216]
MFDPVRFLVQIARKSAQLMAGWGVCVFCAGCASAPTLHGDERIVPGAAFEKVGVLDFRRDGIAEYREMVQPGDLIVNYMRLGRAAKKRQWLHAILPHGHSMIVLDPDDPEGLLECRFRGMRRISPEELGEYSFNTVYRLRDARHLDLERLEQFARVGCGRCGDYSFRSWLGFNGDLSPSQPKEILPSYTCSTMVAAAYHYAGVTLDVAHRNRVVTPLDLVRSSSHPNEVAIETEASSLAGAPDRLAR